MRLLNVSAVGVCALAFTHVTTAAGRDSACAPDVTAERDVVLAVEQKFAAFRTDDSSGFQQIATADFYAYDNGVRFTALSLLDLLRKAHATGTRFEWSVTEPEVHIVCNLAWVTYVNKGSIENAAGHQEMSWLESAVLGYGEGKWRIRFFHSTRAPTFGAERHP
jgi:hypothetical protein